MKTNWRKLMGRLTRRRKPKPTPVPVPEPTPVPVPEPTPVPTPTPAPDPTPDSRVTNVCMIAPNIIAVTIVDRRVHTYSSREDYFDGGIKQVIGSYGAEYQALFSFANTSQ